ncbi:hypothetical protein AVDCRST_MAG81-2038 [uncultured Synechococcales cyanobacterium]|uniref:Uncharacterized protein n=1 Tax=uncultured Synechococcales cyanobacterium TaxID=1936017 RepID=A0A6J4VDG1_9CYAN|nr:hypothetical protein AVDCRST_MAG81-2038 [uncultured Synechococcales cyanobacterium]
MVERRSRIRTVQRASLSRILAFYWHLSLLCQLCQALEATANAGTPIMALIKVSQVETEYEAVVG